MPEVQTNEQQGSDNATGMIDGKKLLNYRDRIARLMSEQKELGGDIKELAKECSDMGLASTKHIRKLARESLADQDLLHEELASLQALRDILGEFGNTPLGEAAVEREEQDRLQRKAQSVAWEDDPKPDNGAASGPDAGFTAQMGYEAGLEGKNPDLNPHVEGSIQAKVWHENWLKGQEARAEIASRFTPGEPAIPTPVPARRRGRQRKDLH